MPIEEQGAGRDRYIVIPRTIVFVRRRNSYLLIRGAANKRLWPGLYNGVGGHIERGESVLDAARREFREETGLEADLWLCGTVLIDAGEIGVSLYVFCGDVTGGSLRSSPEGEAEWVSIDRLDLIPAVRDVPLLLARISRMARGDPPFAARSHYDQTGNLMMVFSD